MRDVRSTWSPRVLDACVLAAVGSGIAILFYNLGGYGLWDPDEGRHAEIARELFAGSGAHRWALLTLNGAPYHDKPILYYLLTSVAYALGGVSAGMARVISATSAACVLALVAWWARREWGAVTAVVATLVLASTAEFVALGRYGDLNMLLTLWITAGVLATYRWIESDGEGWGLIVASVAAGAGTLSKGFVAPVLIGMTTLLYACARGRWRLMGSRQVLVAAGVYALVVLPWFGAVGVLDPAYLRDFLFEHHVRRFLGGGTRHLHPKPAVFTPLMTLVAFLPWSAFLPAMALRAMRAGRRGGASTWLCLAWAGSVVAFFTCSSGKLGTYVLPAMPPLALLVGRVVASLPIEARYADAGRDERWTRRTLLLVGGTFVVLGLALAWLATATLDMGAGAAIARGVLPSLVGAGIVILVRAGRLRRASLGLALGTMATVGVFYGSVAAQVSAMVGDAAVARAIRTADPDGEIPVLAYRAQNASLLFHLERTVPRVDAPRALERRLAAEPETVVVTRPEHVAAFPGTMRVLAGATKEGHAAYLYRRRTGSDSAATHVGSKRLADAPSARATRRRGRRPASAVVARFARPGTTTTGPARSACNDAVTTSAASIHASAGIDDVSMPARSWNSVRVKPGQSACTRTPESRISSATASVKLFT